MTQATDQTLHLTLEQLSAALASGDLSSVEVTEACLRRAEATAALGAFLHLDADGALAAAQASDARRHRRAARGPLDGVPMALKDIFLSEGMPTTCGSKILEGFIAPYDATVVRKLKEAGAVLLGKLNMDEFAMGSSSEHSAFGPVRNPWDPSRVPGGSSGGSAAAVAAGSAFAALGTDTGGSIRQPAAFTGTVGIKPTYGRVSRYGVIAYASSLDQVGPMTKDVTDCACLLGVIAGHDPQDSTSAAVTLSDLKIHLEVGVRGMKLGVPGVALAEGMDPAVRAAVRAAFEAYERLGAELVEVELPHTDYGVAAYYLIATAEASSNLARYDGVRYGLRVDPGAGLADMYQATRGAGFGLEVKRRIMLGTYALSAGYYDAYYRKAQQARTLVRQDYENVFEQVDALLMPVTPTAAFRLGDNIADPLKMYLSDVFTVGANLAGLPALSLPCGETEQGLPIGLQVLGPWWQEERVLRVARAYEREHDWRRRRAMR
jgi:aspartyl-tRNA(Asn)/glutamyl-tRNA(Gln) amidotransferase subunit A